MSVCVLLSNILEVLELQGDESSSYLDKNTGEVITLSLEEFNAAENGESLDDYPEWQHENIKTAAKVLSDCDKNYLPLPSKFDVHEYRIMEDFCMSVQDKETCETLCNAIRGSGAFGRFKNCINRFEITENWYKYRAETFKEIAIQWCQDNDIKYNDDVKN